MANNLKNRITKTFQSHGKWIEKITRTEILVCACGGKYLKTRPRQTTCLVCARVLATKKI